MNRITRWMRYAVFLVSVAACAQTLTITPAAVDRSRSNSFRILLKPAGDHPVTALQWELLIPPELRVDISDIVAGSAADAVDKSITCAVRGGHSPITIGCILAGGTKPIQQGAVAIAKFVASPTAHPGRVLVRLQRALGVSADLVCLPIGEATARVTVR